MLNYIDQHNDQAIFYLVWASITIQSGFTHMNGLFFIYCVWSCFMEDFTFLCHFQVYYFSFHIKSTHMWMLENKATYNKK